ncbi:hypothetical protein Droror1_Dr00023918 [Drosera rotundifolia]
MQMRASCMFMFLVAFYILVTETQGIRLLTLTEDSEIIQSNVMKTKNNGTGKELDLYVEHHSSGKSRKLLSSTMQTSMLHGLLKEAREQEVNHDNHAKSTPSSSNLISGHNRRFEARKFDELMDISEMDYSPARRKAPIHN